MIADTKYDNVDKDWIDIKSNNYFSNEEYAVENKEDSGNRRESPEIDSKDSDRSPKAWFVEF